MHAYALTDVSDETLLSDLAALVASDRQTTADLLAHIGEVDARGLYLPAACSSMHVYCTRVLHFSDDAAYKRIRAARIARRFPQVLDAIADGRVHLAGVVLLAPHITCENVDELLRSATHRSKADVEMLVARIAPKPDVPTKISPVRTVRAGASAPPPFPSPATTPELAPAPLPQLAPGPVAPRNAEPPPRVTPLAPERFKLQLTISQETRDKLERAKALMRHRNPSGDVAVVLDRALDALLATLEKEKFGAASRPRARGARAERANPRYVSNEVKRAVHAQDGEQCSFVGANGARCTERGFLELDHRTPVARGGKAIAGEIRVLCRAHNQYEAERMLGADFMRAKREEARSERPKRAAADASGPRRSIEPDGTSRAHPDVGGTLALPGMGWKAEEAPLGRDLRALAAALSVSRESRRAGEG